MSFEEFKDVCHWGPNLWLLTQRSNIVANSLHHKVSRLAHNAALQPWTPRPDLLLTSFRTNLNFHWAENKSRVLKHLGNYRQRVRVVCVCVPAGDVLSTPGDGDAVRPRCRGVIFKSIHSIAQIFPLTRFIKTL